MTSHDKRWTIERYPEHYTGLDGYPDVKYSYGCPELDLMGYIYIGELLLDIGIKLKED